MTLKEIQKKLKSLKDRGYIISGRKGSTGIGHTLEQELNLAETNIAIPDIGGRVELKATRKDSSSLITLFTFNRGAWQIAQKELIETYGYIDSNDRKALYSTVYYGKLNAQGFMLAIDQEANQIQLIHKTAKKIIAMWSIYTIVGKFLTKLERAIFVFAKARIGKNNKEEFYFNEAYLLEEPSPDKFIEAFEKSLIAIDIRMHLRENNAVRNHGTGIRIFEKDIPQLYGKRRELIELNREKNDH
jgi:hypothetical protein